jgi:hypothetical protein
MTAEQAMQNLAPLLADCFPGCKLVVQDEMFGSPVIAVNQDRAARESRAGVVAQIGEGRDDDVARPIVVGGGAVDADDTAARLAGHRGGKGVASMPG